MSTDRIDGFIASVAIKAPCRMATTANVTLSGLQTLDGITGAEGDRVCVKSQTNPVENGIYVMSSGPWTRALDFNGNRDIVNGTIFKVIEGTVNSEFIFSVGGADPITIGTDAITVTASFKPSTYYPQPIGETVWHSGNDGSGSGLNADLLDGQTGADYHNAALLTGVAPNAALLNGRPDTDFDDAQTLQTRNLAYVLDRSNHTGAFDATLLNGQDSNYYRNASNINAGVLAFDRLPMYLGRYGSGNFTYLPTGWGSAGLTVTHNLGTPNYVCFATCSEPSNLSPVINVNQGTNTMTFTVSDSNNHLDVAANFGFLVVLI